ncbi:unnamed protein product [Gadus morhua 'NCC']
MNPDPKQLAALLPPSCSSASQHILCLHPQNTVSLAHIPPAPLPVNTSSAYIHMTGSECQQQWRPQQQPLDEVTPQFPRMEGGQEAWCGDSWQARLFIHVRYTRYPEPILRSPRPTTGGTRALTAVSHFRSDRQQWKILDPCGEKAKAEKAEHGPLTPGRAALLSALFTMMRFLSHAAAHR